MTEQGGSVILSVVVCTFNRSDLIPDALIALGKQTLSGDLFEVLLVDNNSNDDTSTVAASCGRQIRNYRYLFQPRQGLSHARNLGWKSARGRYVAFLDDDARAAPDWCALILEAFEKASPRPVSVGGKIMPLFEADPPSWFGKEIEIRSWGESEGFLHPPRRKYGFSGSNMAFPKDVLARYGGFSSSLGMQGRVIRLGEESHLFSRIEEQEPWFWYDPEAIVYHLVPKRNMRLAYRLRRAYASGRALAFMKREDGEEKALLKELANTAFFLKRLLVVLLQSPTDRKKQIGYLGDLVKQVGCLLG